MSKEVIEKALIKIKRAAYDPERAHSMEDDLYIYTLTVIKGGAEHPEELAALALRARKIQFPRWYA